jgi:hypothetical protein
MPTDRDVPRARVEPIYRPQGEAGEIIVYVGDVAVSAGLEERLVRGQLELRLFPRAGFMVHFAGPPSHAWSGQLRQRRSRAHCLCARRNAADAALGDIASQTSR